MFWKCVGSTDLRSASKGKCWSTQRLRGEVLIYSAPWHHAQPAHDEAKWKKILRDMCQQSSPPAEKTRLLLTMLKRRRAIVFAFLVYSSDAVEKCNIAAQRLQTKRENVCTRRGLSRLTIRPKHSERRRPTGRICQHIPPCPEFIRSQDYTIVHCFLQ